MLTAVNLTLKFVYQFLIPNLKFQYKYRLVVSNSLPPNEVYDDPLTSLIGVVLIGVVLMVRYR